MQILSWNVNGIRSVNRKGFLKWLKKDSPDILCVQETKIGHIIPLDLRYPISYKSYWSVSENKGRSGVAVYVKQKPIKIDYKIGMPKFDRQGRVLIIEYVDFILLNLYFPHGGRQKEELPYKLKCYKAFLEYLDEIKGKAIILCGDFNIAHKEIDLARHKENVNNIMFTQEERVFIDEIINKGFIDTFRVFHKDSGNYTWWPYRNNLRQRNIGWRIDYIFVSENLLTKLKDAFILSQVKGSDHCPIGIELDI